MDATAVGETETQRRSYPQSTGDYRTGGYEVVREFDLSGNAGRIAEEAVALLSAPALCQRGDRTSSSNRASWPCRSTKSVGPPIELDRVLDGRRPLQAPRFLTLGELGRFRYGSDMMNVVADATIPGALATFGYDDEGAAASGWHRPPMACGWASYQGARDSAATVRSGASNGMMRADGSGPRSR